MHISAKFVSFALQLAFFFCLPKTQNGNGTVAWVIRGRIFSIPSNANLLPVALGLVEFTDICSKQATDRASILHTHQQHLSFHIRYTFMDASSSFFFFLQHIPFDSVLCRGRGLLGWRDAHIIKRCFSYASHLHQKKSRQASADDGKAVLVRA